MTGDPQARSDRARPDRHLAPPREANDKLVTGAVTIGWVIALAVMLILEAIGGIVPAAQHWWTWTCAAGVVMGLFGLWYVPVLQRSRARAAAQALAAQAPAPAGQTPESASDSRESDSKTVSSTETPGRSTRS